MIKILIYDHQLELIDTERSFLFAHHRLLEMFGKSRRKVKINVFVFVFSGKSY